MVVGFIGLGKLGLPVALSIEDKGHEVVGYDIDDRVRGYVESRKIPYIEEGTPELLENTELELMSLGDVVARSDIVFCPVQTPHNPMYEGITRLPEERVDFDYSYLIKAVSDIAESAELLQKHTILVVISTVLPGTAERYIKPLLNPYITLCYNPFFIAMGTTRNDFENPEFVLLGCDDEVVGDTVEGFYKTIHSKPVFRTSIRNAELIKVIYNTFISTKIAFINTVQELCHKTGCNVDAVSDALSLATERIVSSKYLRGGMPDGGGCHPRDNIALSWLAREKNLTFDWFENIMLQRERTIDWYKELIKEHIGSYGRVTILGKSFKRGTNLTIGSPAVLLGNVLEESGIKVSFYDPHLGDTGPLESGVFFVGTNHPQFETLLIPSGSTVIDPWGIVKEQQNVKLVRVGR